MQFLNKIYSVFEKIKYIGLIISAISVLIMMFLMVADIFSRNIIGGSILGTFEITQNYLMIATIFPAIPFLYSTGIMPKMDMFVHKLNVNMVNIITILLVLAELIIYIFLLIYTFNYALSGFLKGTQFFAGGRMYYLYPVQFLIPFAFLLLIIENLFVLIKSYIIKKPINTYVEVEDEYF